MPKLALVILSEVCRGEGTADDPCRTVIQVHATDGKLIAERDTIVREAEAKEVDR